jgi:hypothetical protein
MLPCHRRPLMSRMILPPLVAPLVFRSRQPVKRGLLELTADLVAVALATVIRPADVESPGTSAANQLEDNELVHPARTDENWTTTSATATVPAYWLSIRRLYTRVQAATWTLLRFPPSAPTGTRPGAPLLRPAGPCISRINTEQLAQARGGSRGADAHVEDRLVLDRGDVSRLGGVRRRAVPVARARHVRSVGRLPASNVDAPRGLEARRAADLLPGGPVGATTAIVIGERRGWTSGERVGGL